MLPKNTDLIEALPAEINIPNLRVNVGQLLEDIISRISFNKIVIQLPWKIIMLGVAKTENISTIDITHFDSASQPLLGERYAIEILKLLSKN